MTKNNNIYSQKMPNDAALMKQCFIKYQLQKLFHAKMSCRFVIDCQFNSSDKTDNP